MWETTRTSHRFAFTMAMAWSYAGRFFFLLEALTSLSVNGAWTSSQPRSAMSLRHFSTCRSIPSFLSFDWRQ